MASITIKSVLLNYGISGLVVYNATVYHRLVGASAYVNDGAIVIQPTGLLSADKVISGLLADTVYQIKIKLDCGTTFEKFVNTAIDCPAVTISNIKVIRVGPQKLGVLIEIGGYVSGGIYEVEIYSDNPPNAGGQYMGLYNGSNISFPTNPDELLIDNIHVITPGTTYYARIRTRCGKKVSDWSAFVSYSVCVINPVVEFLHTGSNYEIKISHVPPVVVEVTYNLSFEWNGIWYGPYSLSVPSMAASATLDTGVLNSETSEKIVRINSAYPSADTSCPINY